MPVDPFYAHTGPLKWQFLDFNMAAWARKILAHVAFKKTELLLYLTPEIKTYVAGRLQVSVW